MAVPNFVVDASHASILHLHRFLINSVCCTHIAHSFFMAFSMCITSSLDVFIASAILDICKRKSCKSHLLMIFGVADFEGHDHI